MYRSYAYVTLAMIGLMLMGLSGCGIKGAPVSPGYTQPPAASDVEYRVEGNQLFLTWILPPKHDSDTHPIAGAKVFRLKQSLEDKPCRDCSPSFALIRKVPARSGTMQVRDNIDKGFAYYYKIVLYDTENIDGDDSNIVGFEFQ